MTIHKEICLSGNDVDINLSVHVPETEEEVYKIFWSDDDFIDMTQHEALEKTLELYPDSQILFSMEDRNNLGSPLNPSRDIWLMMGGGRAEGVGDPAKLMTLMGMSKDEAENTIFLVETKNIKKSDILPKIEARADVWKNEAEDALSFIEKHSAEPAPSAPAM